MHGEAHHRWSVGHRHECGASRGGDGRVGPVEPGVRDRRRQRGQPAGRVLGAQWWKDNAVSGGAAPASFKGWAVNVTPTGTCSGTFTTDPGNSSDPPATLAAGSDIVVLVTDDVTKSGDVISGDYTNMLLVDPNPGYQGDPGHPGTGAVVAPACGGGGGGGT